MFGLSRIESDVMLLSCGRHAVVVEMFVVFIFCEDVDMKFYLLSRIELEDQSLCVFREGF